MVAIPTSIGPWRAGGAGLGIHGVHIGGDY